VALPTWPKYRICLKLKIETYGICHLTKTYTLLVSFEVFIPF